MIRPRGGTTRPRDDEEGEAASSAEEIGRLLRDSREGRGLDLLTVHDRLDRPITQIEALEQGDLARLPDQAMALSTLRRYAAFLGLDGDALALQMIDAFSALPAGGRTGSGDPATSSVATVVTAGPDHLRAFTQTGEVPTVGGGSSGPPTGSGAYGYGLTSGPPTGTFPVVPRHDLKHSRRAVARARRRLRAPTALKVVTWVAAALVLVVMAGFVIYRSQPRWLVQAHILRVAPPGAPGAPGPVARTASPAAAPARSQVLETSSEGASASYTVNATPFTVAIVTSGPCWVQITSSTATAPLVSGVQPAGKSLSVPATGTMTVQVGSSAVVVGVTAANKPVFLDTPHITPFTYTFTPATPSTP